MRKQVREFSPGDVFVACGEEIEVLTQPVLPTWATNGRFEFKAKDADGRVAIHQAQPDFDFEMVTP